MSAVWAIKLVYITDNGKIQRDTGWKPETGLKKNAAGFCRGFWQENHGMLARRRSRHCDGPCPRLSWPLNYPGGAG